MKEKVRKAAKKVSGEEPVKIEKIGKGLIHDTYSFEADEESYILQFSGSNKDHSMLDDCLKWYRKFRDSDIPVPEPVTEQPREVDGREYIVVEKLPGETIDQDISPEKTRKAGRVLAKIHNFCSFEKPGWIDTEEEIHDFEEGGLRQRTLKKNREKAEILRNSGMRELGDRLEEFVENNIDTVPEDFQPVLVHEDYSPDNVLFSDGELTGVIDFDYAHSGHANQDLVKSANTFWMHDPGADWNVRQTFYDGYREVRELDDSFQEQEQFYRIQTLAHLVASLIEMDELDQDEQQFYREKLMEELSK